MTLTQDFQKSVIEEKKDLYGRVERFSYFCDFRKWIHCCQLALFFLVQFQKLANLLLFKRNELNNLIINSV